jgi:hypothetical protein
MTGMAVEFSGVWKRFGAASVLKDVSLDLP